MIIQKPSQHQFLCDNKNGYITLISVLIISAIAVSIATSVLLLGLGSSKTSFTNQQTLQSQNLAQACAEDALQQIRDNINFTSTNTLPLGDGTCTYTVMNTGGTNRSINASGFVGTTTRRIQIQITAINPKIIISSWQEVADF